MLNSKKLEEKRKIFPSKFTWLRRAERMDLQKKMTASDFLLEEYKVSTSHA